MKTYQQAMEWLLDHLIENPYEIALVHIQQVVGEDSMACISHVEVGLSDPPAVMRQVEFDIDQHTAAADVLCIKVQWLNRHLKWTKFTRKEPKHAQG